MSRKYWANAGRDENHKYTYKKRPCHRSVLIVKKPDSCWHCPLLITLDGVRLCPFGLTSDSPVPSGPDPEDEKLIKANVFGVSLTKPDKLSEVFPEYATYRQENCPLNDLPDYFPDDRSEALEVFTDALEKSEQDGLIHTNKDAEECRREDEAGL